MKIEIAENHILTIGLVVLLLFSFPSIETVSANEAIDTIDSYMQYRDLKSTLYTDEINSQELYTYIHNVLDNSIIDATGYSDVVFPRSSSEYIIKYNNKIYIPIRIDISSSVPSNVVSTYIDISDNSLVIDKEEYSNVKLLEILASHARIDSSSTSYHYEEYDRFIDESIWAENFQNSEADFGHGLTTLEVASTAVAIAGTGGIFGTAGTGSIGSLGMTGLTFSSNLMAIGDSSLLIDQAIAAETSDYELYWFIDDLIKDSSLPDLQKASNYAENGMDLKNMFVGYLTLRDLNAAFGKDEVEAMLDYAGDNPGFLTQAAKNAHNELYDKTSWVGRINTILGFLSIDKADQARTNYLNSIDYATISQIDITLAGYQEKIKDGTINGIELKDYYSKLILKELIIASVFKNSANQAERNIGGFNIIYQGIDIIGNYFTGVGTEDAIENLNYLSKGHGEYANAIRVNTIDNSDIYESYSNFNEWLNSIEESDMISPIANAGLDQVTKVGDNTYFDGSGSNDNAGITHYSWDFDDGDGIQEDAIGSFSSHTYDSPGTYIVTLTVNDAKNNGPVSDTLKVDVLLRNYDVVISSVTTSMTVNPGSTASYSMTLENNGNEDDIFQVSSDRGTLSRTSFPLRTGEQASFTFQDTSLEERTNIATITAKSKGDPVKSSMATITTAFDNGPPNSYCDDWNVVLSSNKNINYYLDYTAMGPYCSNNWHIKDYDGDGYNEHYLLVREKYYQWSYGRASKAFSQKIDDFSNYDVSESYGCTDEMYQNPKKSNCDSRIEYSWKSKELTNPSNRLYSIDMFAIVFDKYGNRGVWGWIKDELFWYQGESEQNAEHIEYYQVLKVDPTFTISVQPNIQKVIAGKSASYILSLIGLGKFSAPITFSCSGLPEGANCYFYPNPADTVESSIPLEILTSDSTPNGVYPIIITGTGGGDTKNTKLILVVSALPTLSVEPVLQKINAGSPASYTISLDGPYEFNEPVMLSCSGVPVGAHCDFNPNPTTSPSTSILKILTSSSTPEGTYPISIKATYKDEIKTKNIVLILGDVTPPTLELWPDTRYGEYIDFKAWDNIGLNHLILYYKSTQADTWKTRNIDLSGKYSSSTIWLEEFPFGTEFEYYAKIYDNEGNSNTTEIRSFQIMGVKINHVSIPAEIEYGTPFNLSLNITTNAYNVPIFAGIRGGKPIGFSYTGHGDVTFSMNEYQNISQGVPLIWGYTFYVYKPLSGDVNEEINLLINISYSGGEKIYADGFDVYRYQRYDYIPMGLNKIETLVHSWFGNLNYHHSTLVYDKQEFDLNVTKSSFFIENVDFPSIFLYDENQYINVTLYNGNNIPVNGFDLIISVKEIQSNSVINFLINGQEIEFNPNYILKSNQTVDPFSSKTVQVPVKINLNDPSGSYIENSGDINGNIDFEIRVLPHDKTIGAAYDNMNADFIYKTPLKGKLSLTDSISQISNNSLSESYYQICNNGDRNSYLDFCKIILEDTEFYYNISIKSPVNGTNISITLDTFYSLFGIIDNSPKIRNIGSISANETINVSFRLKTIPGQTASCGDRGDVMTSQSRSSLIGFNLNGKLWSEEYKTYFNIGKSIDEYLYLLPKPKFSEIYFFEDDNGSINYNKPISNIAIGDIFYVVMDETEFPWYEDCLWKARYDPKYNKLWQTEYYNTSFHLIAPNSNDSIQFVSGSGFSTYYGDFTYKAILPPSLPYKYIWKFKAAGSGEFPIRASLSYDKKVDGQNVAHSIQKNRTIKVLKPPELYLERKNFDNPIIDKPGIQSIKYRIYNLGEITAKNINLRITILNPNLQSSTTYPIIDEIQPGWYQDFDFSLDPSVEGIYTLYIFNNEDDKLLETFKVAYHNPDGENLFEKPGAYIEKYQEKSFDVNISKDYQRIRVEWWGSYNGDNIALKLVSPNNTEYNLGSSSNYQHSISGLDYLEKGIWKVNIYCANTNYLYRCLDFYCYNKLYYTYANAKINSIYEEPDPLPNISVSTNYYGKDNGNDPGTHLTVSVNISNNFTKNIGGYIHPDIPFEYYRGNLDEDYVGSVPQYPLQYQKTWDFTLYKAGIVPVTIAFRDSSGNFYNKTVVANVPGYSSLFAVSPAEYYHTQPGDILNFSIFLKDLGGSSSIEVDLSTFDKRNWNTSLLNKNIELENYVMRRIDFNVTVPENVSGGIHNFIITGHPMGYPWWNRFDEIVEIEVENKTIEIPRTLTVDSIQLEKEEIYVGDTVPVTVNVLDALNNPINVEDLFLKIIGPENSSYNISLLPSQDNVGIHSGNIYWTPVAGTYNGSIYLNNSNFSLNETYNISYKVNKENIVPNFTINSMNTNKTILSGEDVNYYFSIKNNGLITDQYTLEMSSMQNINPGVNSHISSIQNINNNNCENYQTSLENLTITPKNIDDIFMQFDGKEPGIYNCTLYIVSSINQSYYEMINLSTEILNPDISFADNDIYYYPIEIHSGDKLTILAKIKIIGALYRTFNVSLYNGNPVSGGNELQTKIIRPSNVVNEEIGLVFSIVPESGTYNLYIMVDEDNLIIESDENNNVINTTIDVLSDNKSPASVTNPSLQSSGSTWLNFTWANPPDYDFSHIRLYLNGSFITNIMAPQNYYNFTGLEPDTLYELGTHTVDSSGNVNETWVNATARTLPLNIEKIDFTLPLKTGWNMVSLPIIPDDPSVTAIFGSNVTTVYGWTGTSYVLRNELEPRRGYWALSSSNYEITITGTPVVYRDITLTRGWNMVGPVTNGIMVSSLPNVTTVYGWTGNSYTIVSGSNTLILTRGYWMLANASSIIQV